MRQRSHREKDGDENRMSRTWVIPDVAEYEYGKPPSIWWCVIAFIVIQIAGVIMTVLTWEQGKPVMSGTFFMRMLLLPLLAWGGICAVIYTRYEDWIEQVDWWNFLCRRERADWRRWAQDHVAIVASVALTPEPELAERLLGLEGSAPMNPGKIMALPEKEMPAGTPRIGRVLEQLVRPLAGSISRFARDRSCDVVLQSDDAQDLNELRAVWRNLNLPGLVDFGWLPFDAEQTTVEHWFARRSHADFRLVLACQLHSAQAEPACSEIAVALLLTSSRVVAELKGKLRPQARLFRPISKPSDSIEDALDALLAAEQTPRARIRHAWFSNLPRQSRHASISAIKEAGLDLSTHDVDHALGKPGPVNALLLQTLAAHMVEHGQGAQLVASPHAQGVTLNVVGAQPAPLPDVEAGYFRMLSLSVTLGVTCCITLIMFMLEVQGAWFWGCIAGIVLLLPLQVGGSILKRRGVEDDFYRMRWRSGAWTS
jgi:hypothetical protein